MKNFFLAIMTASLLLFGSHSLKAQTLLRHSDLVELYERETIPPELQVKLDQLLNTPFVSNAAARRQIPGAADSIRIASWNIERGLEFEAIRAALTNDQSFFRRAARMWKATDAKRLASVLAQVKLLHEADILILNEVDWGLKRTGYRNVAKELATAAGMNYAYAVEFVEVDPLTLGTETFAEAPASERTALVKNNAVDKSRTLGLHGTAILSRFPLSNARILRFREQGHDWYTDEKKSKSKIESAKNKAAQVAFSEKIVREVRRGNRMALLADIVDPAFPERTLTVVATHLEAKAEPESRRKQLEEILTYLKDTRHAVVIAGDMNTSGTDGVPTSFQREMKKRLGSEKFWVTQGVKYATGIGLLYDITVGLVKNRRMQSDPSVKSVKFVSENPEERFFSVLKVFRFSDGNGFDFRGTKKFSIGNSSETLSNSNERASKGFASTLELIGRATVKLKLDWIFVKPANVTDSSETTESYIMAPAFGRTLKTLNYSLNDRISDHNPIIADLFLREPRQAP